MGYVDSLEEQAILEELIEGSKPNDRGEDYHYLLKTPFRYPPLKYGSRFGHRHEPSLFYGGDSIEAALVESAYYRLVYLTSSKRKITRIPTEHTLLSVDYATASGVKLQDGPFQDYEAQLTDKQSCTVSRNLGSDMRAAGVEAFQYLSARSAEKDVCVALFSPDPFVTKKPTSLSQWLCETTTSFVSFRDVSSPQVHTYPYDMFCVNDIFPMPG